MNADVRDRSREILRAELAVAASDFCAERGFESVTVDDIAQAIGVSRATFFRYFGSKEDAVVAAARTVRTPLADGIRGEPAGVSAWTAARSAMAATVEVARVDPGRLRSRVRMISASPALRARLALHHADDRVELAEALTERMTDPHAARAVAGAAMAAIDLGWSLWASDSSADLGTELDRAFALVADAGAARLQ